MESFKLYIDGNFESGAACFSSLNPATAQPWAEIAEARGDEVNRAVAAAKRAFHDPAWRGLTAGARGKLLLKLAELVERNADELARIETLDTGKIIRETRAQIAYVAEYYRYYAGLADKMEGRTLAIDKADTETWTRREPVGVVAAIIPWNSQLFLSAVKIGPALAAGCTLVVKAAESAPAPLLAFARLVAEAGFPPGVCNVITGFAEACGTALTTHPDVDHIAFTGGPETARHIVRNSAENLSKTTLELGGKSPFIVFEDADLDSAANAQVAAIFAASGQSCVAGSRLLVAESIKDKLLAKLVERVERIVIGAPDDAATQFGPLCTQRQKALIEQVVNRSLAQGARLVCGNQAIDSPGYYYPPTILDCSKVPQAESVVRELFGPVLSVVAFRDEAEAIRLANTTDYGLAAGVFTRNLALAHRATRDLRCGVVWINTYRMVSPLAPFGGYGLSGHGREGGMEAALEFTTTKTVWLRTSDEPIDDPFIMR
ncbi:aldehyde dehydrogenase [Serratia ficaria]|uniref:Betaine aldehyde dehydrogenase n=1 Tax=Serratia ficaria TaxID=61651 RepID=A0A240C779_SERFI|nr:aldehyde dehydrogenase [Serratia ficaria]REF43940.1 aldehyde dehydrogenase (NAD+) [Serratia ficaria]CAI0723458.1 Betaine aldehyde dehydrogenase [Serratia ficaria]CAI0741944.1 Betaine aldehyde dehydrogenase [Serratia ficaria]CAI0752159.1 Betaine aldehyde dehydrogenase [Serratia ficaria]CAI1939764.1 Betaine aldehyde dehydrogenase [Serratia ficaria]